MDLLDKLIENPTIKTFLEGYPQSEWPSVVTQAVLYAVYSYKGLQRSGLHPPKRPQKPSKPKNKPTRINSKRNTKPVIDQPSSKRKIPKYLLNIDSKIKEQVLKDKNKNTERNENLVVSVTPKHASSTFQWEESPHEGKHNYHKASISSIYSNVQIFDEDVPRRLQPVELTLNEGRLPSYSVDMSSSSDT